MNQHDQTPDPTPGLDLAPDTQQVLTEPTAGYPTGYATDHPSPPAVEPAEPAARGRRPMRVRTTVFGLVMLAISVASLVALLTDIRVDGAVVGLVLLIGAGAALVAGGVAAAVREAKGGPGSAG